MKIVQVCPYDIGRPGGVQRHIVSLAGALRNMGHEVRIVAPGPSQSESSELLLLGRQREIGFSGTRFELTWASDRDLRRLQDALDAWQPDLIHFHTIWSPLMPFQVFRRWDGPVVATFHDTPPDGRGGDVLRFLFGQMSRWLLSRIDGAIAVSPAPAAHLKAGAEGVTPVVIPPAVDLSAIRGAGRAQRTGDGVRFLFVGRLEERKGIARLLKAWSSINDRMQDGPPLVLTIAGGGELLPLVEAARQRPARHRIEYVGRPDDAALRTLYRDADVFVAPSPFGESFGIVLTEAMTSGLPVIAAANAGYSSVLTGEGSAGLVAPYDTDALAAAMVRFAGDPDLRAALGEWGRREAAQYDIAAVAPRIEEVYRSALARRRASAT